MRAAARLAGVRQSGGWAGWLSFAVVFAVAAGVVTTGPVFVAAVSDAVAEDAVERASGLDRAVQLQANAQFGPGLAEADAAADRQFAGITGLDAGPTTYAFGGNRTSAANGDTSLGGTVRIVARDGALDALDVVAGSGTEGVWVSERVAGLLELVPGEAIEVRDPGFRFDLPVSGVYRDFDLTDFGPYWSLVPLQLLPREFRVFGGVVQPELLIVAEETLFALDRFIVAQSGPVGGRVWWQATAASGVTGDAGLTELAAGVAGIERSANDATTRFGSALRAAGIGQVVMRTSLLELNADVVLATERIKPAIAPVRVAGVALGLGVVGLGAWFVARRRAVELRLWAVAGRSELSLGAAAAMAAVPPAILGGAVGAWIGPVVVLWLGPSNVLHTDVVPLLGVAATMAAGVAIVGATTAASALRLMATGAPARWMRLAGEASVYLLAVTLIAQLLRRDPARAEPGELDLATVLAPVLGAAALVMLGGRGLTAVVRRLRRRGGALPPGLFLAWRRVAAGAADRMGVVLPIAVAAAVALFSSLLVASVDDGLDSKSIIAVGSEVAAPMRRAGVPDSIPEGMTLVWTGSASGTGTSRVMLMVIDADTYHAGTRWDTAFGLPLDDMLELLAEPGDRVPVVLTGGGARDLPVEGAVRTQAVELAYRRVAELEAVPAMSSFLPTMVVDRATLLEWAQAHPEVSGFALPRAAAEADPSVAPEVSGIEAAAAPAGDDPARELLLGLAPRLLSTRDATSVETFLARAGQPTGQIATRADLLADGALTAQRWAFAYLRVLGMTALGLSLAALGFAMIEAQRRLVVANALARRMGARRAASAKSLAAEIAALTGVAVLLGIAAGWALALGVLDRFDPLPTLPPGLRTPLPVGAFGLVALVAGAGAGLVWWVAGRAASRADVSEVLRG